MIGFVEPLLRLLQHASDVVIRGRFKPKKRGGNIEADKIENFPASQFIQHVDANNSIDFKKVREEIGLIFYITNWTIRDNLKVMSSTLGTILGSAQS